MNFDLFSGRSRNLIISELRRTNLDVNLAVNNLLSRNEEDGDDGEEGGQDNYVPEDLISLLDAGINAEHPSVIIDADAMFSEDMFGYSQRRSSSSSNRYTSPVCLLTFQYFAGAGFTVGSFHFFRKDKMECILYY